MRTKRKIRSGILTLIMAMTVSMAVPAAAEAAGPKKLQKVTLKIGGMDMTKQTYSVSKGKTAAIKAVGKPASAKKAVSYKSSNTKVVAVSKKGKVTAKRKGTAQISVTVKGKNGGKKTAWLKIRVTAAGKEISPISSAPSASCDHDWKFISGEDAEQAPVYLIRAKEYNVCKHCGYIGTYQEVASHCFIFGGFWENVPLGPEVKRQDWICTDLYKCKKCGKEKTEQYTETGDTVTVYYENSRLNWEVINNEMGRVRCPGCGEVSALEWISRDGGKCICGRELHYTEDDIFYPWTLSKAYPESEDEHYREIDKEGNIVILK